MIAFVSVNNKHRPDWWVCINKREYICEDAAQLVKEWVLDSGHIYTISEMNLFYYISDRFKNNQVFNK